jgi:hypothetical protein
MRTLRLTIALLLTAALAFLLALHRQWIAIPDDWNPWATLDIHAEPNLLTRHKLSRLSTEPAICAAVLATATMRFEALPDRVTGEQCGFFDAVRIDRTTSAVSAPFSLSCPAAVSLALWEHHVVQPAARAHFGAPVTLLEHFGSYACRNVDGRENARRSQHATADALDVAGFVIGESHRIRVLGDWHGNRDEARFLRDVHSGACRFFDGVLSPDYNAAHRDHLHVDRGRFRICR